MNNFTVNDYYQRKEIQKAILKFSENREIAVKFDTYFGKRPEIIEYLSDIKKFVSKGVTSFHMSEEKWLNPLILADKNLSEYEKENNRLGWDLILDLDGVDFEFAKIVAKIIIKYLNKLNIFNVSIKFSGNKGFHIGIPFEAFSKNIIGIGETRKLFPEIPKKIAIFLMEELKGDISKEILNLYDNSIEKISKRFNIPLSKLKNNDLVSNNLNYTKLIEIDTILITSRHLFRMPYSLNEKSGLVSIPVDNSKILSFERKEASPELVEPSKYKEYEFLRYNNKYGKDADILLIKAYEGIDEDYLEKISKNLLKERIGEKKGIIFTGSSNEEIFEINEKISFKEFPKTIKFILNNRFKDGKKRAMFILITFLYSIKYNSKIIDEIIREWNKKQPEPLNKNLINAQLNWFKNQSKIISPPNFFNQEYYSSIGIDEKIILEDVHKFKPIKIKNPLHYVFVYLKQKKLKKNLKNN